MIFPLYQDALGAALSGAGVITVTEYYTAWTTTDADGGTLADGSKVGQMKKVTLIADGGDGILTPNLFVDGATITFADAGDFVVLMWTGEYTGWRAIETGNDADGATGPVIA